jgi:DNA-directed RNA polymerase
MMNVENDIWEAAMRAEAVERHEQNRDKARASGRETTAEPFHGLMTSLVRGTVREMEARLKRRGRPPVGAAWIKKAGVTPAQAVMIGAITAIDGISQGHSMQALAERIGTRLEDEFLCSQFKKAEPSLYAWMMDDLKSRGSQDYRHKRKTVLAAMNRTNEEIEGLGWTKQERANTGLYVLDVLLLGGVLMRGTLGAGRAARPILRLTPEAESALNERDDMVQALLRPWFKPTLVAPLDWVSPSEGGYHTHAEDLVKTRKRQYLEQLRQAEMPDVYQALNAIQRTAWRVNDEVLATAEYLWKREMPLPGLKLANPGLAPVRPDFPPPPAKLEGEDKERLREWKLETRAWHEAVAEQKSRWLQTQKILSVADELRERDEFYFPHNLDYRGRAYALPLLFNPQGSDFSRGILTFAEAKPVGELGGFWLAVHGANCMGKIEVDGKKLDLSKLPLNERADWVCENEAAIVAVAVDPLSNTLWHGADEPWQFLAFCGEWSAYLRSGESPDFESRLPVSIDGSCNGLQHFSAMLRDPEGAEVVNLRPLPRPRDVYQLVAEAVSEVVRKDAGGAAAERLQAAEAALPGALELRDLAWDLRSARVPLVSQEESDEVSEAASAAESLVATERRSLAASRAWLAVGVDRDTVKRAVMTTPYGVTAQGIEKQLMKKYRRDPVYREAFGEYGVGVGCRYLTPVIDAAIGRLMAGPRASLDFLRQAGQVVAEHERPLAWRTPVGFPVLQEAFLTTQFTINTRLLGRVQLHFVEDTARLDKRKQATAVAPNFVHSQDAAHLCRTIVRLEAGGKRAWSAVHDSFGTHAGDVQELSMALRATFVELYEDREPLATFASQVAALLPSDVQLPVPPPQGDFDVREVLEAEFFFA